MALDPKKRKQVENLIIKVMDRVDTSGTNTKYYKDLFSKLSDTQFMNWMKKEYPIRFQMRTGTTNPSMTDIIEALKIINVPLTEKIYTPALYRDKNGRAVASQECTVMYLHLKKVQQFITHKNKWSSSIANRDNKTGLLVGRDKGALTSDREFESLASWGLTNTMEEFAGSRGDDMQAKNYMYNQISSTGMFKLKDIPKSVDGASSKNLLNTYLLGAHITSNLINKDNYTYYSLRKKKNLVTRS